jgi:hypothetical protein
VEWTDRVRSPARAQTFTTNKCRTCLRAHSSALVLKFVSECGIEVTNDSNPTLLVLAPAVTPVCFLAHSSTIPHIVLSYTSVPASTLRGHIDLSLNISVTSGTQSRHRLHVNLSSCLTLTLTSPLIRGVLPVQAIKATGASARTAQPVACTTCCTVNSRVPSP